METPKEALEHLAEQDLEYQGFLAHQNRIGWERERDIFIRDLMQQRGYKPLFQLPHEFP